MSSFYTRSAVLCHNSLPAECPVVIVTRTDAVFLFNVAIFVVTGTLSGAKAPGIGSVPGLDMSCRERLLSEECSTSKHALAISRCLFEVKFKVEVRRRPHNA